MVWPFGQKPRHPPQPLPLIFYLFTRSKPEYVKQLSFTRAYTPSGAIFRLVETARSQAATSSTKGPLEKSKALPLPLLWARVVLLYMQAPLSSTRRWATSISGCSPRIAKSGGELRWACEWLLRGRDFPSCHSQIYDADRRFSGRWNWACRFGEGILRMSFQTNSEA